MSRKHFAEHGAISRAICAGLIEVMRPARSRASPPQFPAQFARASLKSAGRPGDPAVVAEFPAQFARASLKLPCMGRMSFCEITISRAICAGLIEVAWGLANNQRGTIISRAICAGLIEVLVILTCCRKTFTISRAICAGLIEVPTLTRRKPGRMRISRAICAGLIEVILFWHKKPALYANFPRNLRGPH